MEAHTRTPLSVSRRFSHAHVEERFTRRRPERSLVWRSRTAPNPSRGPQRPTITLTDVGSFSSSNEDTSKETPWAGLNLWVGLAPA